MKIKSLAMLAASGLMAASLAYVVPASAAPEDEFNDATLTADQSTPSDVSSSQDVTSGDAANTTGNATGSSAANSVSSEANGNGNTGGSDAPAGAVSGDSSASNTSNSPSEPGTPDVASGDDDY
jgi:hypothetical protein